MSKRGCCCVRSVKERERERKSTRYRLTEGDLRVMAFPIAQLSSVICSVSSRPAAKRRLLLLLLLQLLQLQECVWSLNYQQQSSSSSSSTTTDQPAEPTIVSPSFFSFSFCCCSCKCSCRRLNLTLRADSFLEKERASLPPPLITQWHTVLVKEAAEGEGEGKEQQATEPRQ